MLLTCAFLGALKKKNVLGMVCHQLIVILIVGLVSHFSAPATFLNQDKGMCPVSNCAYTGVHSFMFTYGPVCMCIKLVFLYTCHVWGTAEAYQLSCLHSVSLVPFLITCLSFFFNASMQCTYQISDCISFL